MRRNSQEDIENGAPEYSPEPRRRPSQEDIENGAIDDDD